MNNDQHVTHTPVGYLIVVEHDALIESNEYYRDFGVYFGVDRPPPFLAPDEQIRSALGIPFITNARLRNALEEWFEIGDTGTPFIRNHQVAIRLLTTFRDFGYELALLFCERASTEEPGETEDAQSLFIQDTITETYGYDVSWPSCNHSAILQPGHVPGSPIWRGKLNKWGLLSDFFTARTLQDEYLKVYPYPPFEIYRVHSDCEGQMDVGNQ